MKYRIRHRTLYGYSEPVALGHNQVVAEPRQTSLQTVHQSALEVEPEPQFSQSRRDHFGNRVTYFTTERAHRELTILMRAEVTVQPGPEPTALPRGTVAEAQNHPPLEAAPFLYRSPMVPVGDELRALGDLIRPERALVDCLVELTARIHERFAYVPGATAVYTPVSEVLRLRRGVCQDFAHVMLGVLRSHGLAARYVSGYLRTHPPPGRPRLVGADASHAWVSAYLPGHGWLDFDPTNNAMCAQDHIVAAWGRDYLDVAPVRGVVLGGGRQTVQVSVDVADA